MAGCTFLPWWFPRFSFWPAPFIFSPTPERTPDGGQCGIPPHPLMGRSVIVMSPMSEHSKFLLADSQITSVWVNVLPSLPEPMAPPLHPGTRAPLSPQDLLPLFPMELIEQEFSLQPLIDIPGEVMDIYRLWRATPLYRARRLEKLLDTPAHIYYKYEGTSPAGSH